MSRTLVLGLILVLFPLACLPLALSKRTGNFAEDEKDYYIPSVTRIAAHWPALDLIGDSTSATSPGYAYILAGLSKVIGVNTLAFRICTLLISTGLLALLFSAYPTGTAPFAGLAILPLAASNFFIKSASWVVTDNVSLLLVCVALLSLLGRRNAEDGCLPAGFSAAAAIFVRQLHAWLVAPIGFHLLLVKFRARAGDRSRQLMAASAALALPLSVLLWIRCAWGGFVPPQWQATNDAGIFPASVACASAVFFAFGIFYFLSVSSFGDLVRLARSWEALVGAAVGLAVAAVTRNGMDRAAGRWGGYFWMAIQHTPAVAGRSLAIVALSTLGGALVGVMHRRLFSSAGAATSSLWTLSLAAWLASCALNRLAFQRYFEPPILVFLILWLAIVSRGDEPNARGRWRLLSLALVSLVQAAITIGTTFLPLCLTQSSP